MKRSETFAKCLIHVLFQQHLNICRYEDVLFLGPVSEDLIRKLISDAPPKSCALHPILTALLNKCYEELVPCITKIVNFSLGGETEHTTCHA